jgi:hypothetical protein
MSLDCSTFACSKEELDKSIFKVNPVDMLDRHIFGVGPEMSRSSSSHRCLDFPNGLFHSGPFMC